MRIHLEYLVEVYIHDILMFVSHSMFKASEGICLWGSAGALQRPFTASRGVWPRLPLSPRLLPWLLDPHHLVFKWPSQMAFSHYPDLHATLAILSFLINRPSGWYHKKKDSPSYIPWSVIIQRMLWLIKCKIISQECIFLWIALTRIHEHTLWT